MEVIKISGIEEDANIIQSNMEKFFNHNPIFIIDKEKSLYKFIENLKIHDNLLYRLKIAKEIDFANISVELKDNITDNTTIDNIISLSNLLKEIDEDKVKNCKLIIDTEDNNLISEVIQALIYLNIDLQVMMKREKAGRRIVNAFRTRFDKIRNSVVKGEKAVHNIEATQYFRCEKENVLDKLYNIEDDMEKARERQLNISVMSTKKAGKSVVVNSFLNEEYAPTSFELPTPNTCIYKRSKDNNIRLLYGDSDIIFESREDIYKYIYTEFKKAQDDIENGYTIDNMEIYYTSTNNSFDSFTIIDTPGCNYALATDIKSGNNIHKNIAYQWIEKSDVVVFLINYSNYLSADEEEFFKDIKAQFEKYEKFYSLIVVVNKLDEMFISEYENKSVVRFLDYIRCKFNDLGYRGFTVMATSARSYFDAIKVCKMDSNIMESLGETVTIEKLKGDMLRERLKILKKNFIGKPEMSALCFVDDQLEKLECFYGLKDYDLDTLKEKSGMIALVNYTRYIGTQKANIELYGLLIRSIDEKFVKIRNNNTIKTLIDSKKEKTNEIKNMESMIHNIIYSFKSIEEAVESKLNFAELQDNLLNNIKVTIDNRLNHILDLCKSRINEFFMRFILKTSEQLYEVKNNAIDIDLLIDNKIFNEEINEIIEDFLKTLNCQLDEKEKYIREAENKMKETIKIFSDIVKKEYGFDNFNIEVPKLEGDFKKRLLIKMSIIDINNDIMKEKILDSIEGQESILKKLLNYFIKNKFEIYKVNSTKLWEVEKEYSEYITNNISKQYDDYYNVLSENLIEVINEYKVQSEESFKSSTSIYKDIFTDMLDYLSNTKTDVENQLESLDTNIQFFNKIDDAIKDFTDVWNLIRKAGED